MANKRSGSSAQGRQAKKSVKSTPDRKINFSDIPELSDRQLEAMKPLGRPLLGNAPRKLIAVRVDTEVLEKLRKEAKKKGTGYQSLINEILSKHAKRKAA